MTARVIKIIPRPYLVESLINADHWNWPKALSEFVDNSFGEAAGAAQNVTIHLDRNSIKIEDDGRGIANLQQCFILGESTSRYSDTDIGRYGVGSKHASVWMGARYRVETTHNGVRKWWLVNWNEVRRGDDWPTYEERNERAAKGAHGTIATVGGIWPGRKRPVTDHIARVLGETFAPALQDGRTITLIDHRSKGEAVTRPVAPWRPSGLSDVVQIAGEVGGRSYAAEIGILSNQYSGDAGLRLCFAHRVIESIKRLGDEAIPIRIFGYVRLSSQWKDRLSANKSEIVDSHDLEESIANHPDVKRIFALADEFQETMLIEGILSQVEVSLNDALKAAKDGAERAERAQSRVSVEPSEPNPSPPVTNNREPDGKPADQTGSSGLQITVQALGSNIIGLVKEDRDISVILNKDCPLVADAIAEATTRGRGYYPALISVVGSILACHVRKQGGSWLRKRFRLSDPDEVDGSEIETLLRWWFFKVAGAAVRSAEND